ncbi:dnaJ homolog subfamily C member 3-like [Gigantopelta aegis]|uniref:dnaJ homolog subfamily C member 3-like n=1 Tax=Gigantopelta aegis TaxID=1735272 RepID=UPI001B8876C0|nr:dnaJ homolog subfamily C member 3-like [Gigantopelta aegis]
MQPPIQVLQSISLIILVDFCLDGSDAGNIDVEKNLEMGKKLLAAGQLAEALSHYHLAVEGDPKNYLTYFRRATVYLAIGKSRSALPDLDRCIELRPDFTAARIQRGNVLLKQGKLDKARADFTKVLKQDPHNEEAHSQFELMNLVEDDVQQANIMYKHHDFNGAIELLSRLIDICPWDADLREIRSECYIQVGEKFKAIGDLRSTTKLIPDNTQGFFKMSKLHYNMGEAEESLIQIRECLKLDPEHKDCYPHYKKVKKLVKQLQAAQEYSNNDRYDECIDKAKQILKTESKIFHYFLQAHSHMCHCHSKAGHISDALKICQEILEIDEGNINALIDRAEAHILNEDYQAAINDFQRAQQIDEENRRVHDGLNRAQKLLKQSKKRDYYKILGVKRTAKKKQILKAYRDLAKIWHPDKYDGDDKKKAEKMFIDLASAKEVLTDKEKRQRFDNGEDPLDPEDQQGGNPFHHGFNPFGGGGSGFSFKFHFN